MANIPAPIKYVTITVAALVTTILCFLLMQFLIQNRLSQAPPAEPPTLAAPFEHSLDELRPREARTRAQRIIPAEPPPDPEGIPISPETLVVVVNATRPTLGSVSDFVDFETIDFQPYPPVRDLVPLYVVQPVYPFKAVMKEIEGFVVVHFGVRENGTVRNPVVVESEPRALFDEAALSAISKFRFQPRMVGGDPVSATNLQMKFVFRMVDGSGTQVVDGVLVRNRDTDI